MSDLASARPTLKLLYITPEMVASPAFQPSLGDLSARGLVARLAVDEERLMGEAAPAKWLLTLTLPKAGGALGPTRVLTPDGAGAAPSASLRSHSARRFVALASVKLAQMPQTGSAPESAASAWVLPRQVTH